MKQNRTRKEASVLCVGGFLCIFGEVFFFTLYQYLLATCAERWAQQSGYVSNDVFDDYSDG